MEFYAFFEKIMQYPPERVLFYRNIGNHRAVIRALQHILLLQDPMQRHVRHVLRNKDMINGLARGGLAVRAVVGTPGGTVP